MVISPCDSRLRRASMVDDVCCWSTAVSIMSVHFYFLVSKKYHLTLSITMWESLDESDDGGWYFIDGTSVSARMRQLHVVKTKGMYGVSINKYEVFR